MGIQFDKVWKLYQDKPVLSNFTKVIGNSDLTLITGNNGSGKSTLLRIIQNEIPIDKGNVLFSEDFHQNFFSDYLGYSLYGQLTVMENQEVLNFDTSDFFSLKEIINKKISNLSSGEIQKIALVRVLASVKKWLIFDEPTSHLDQSAKFEFINYLKIEIEKGKKIILTTHESDLFKDFDSTKINLS